MIGSMLVLIGCGEPAPLPPRHDPVATAEDLRASVAAWRAKPDDSRLGSVNHAVERALTIAPSTRELDLALADAHANVLLDPGAAMLLYEQHHDDLPRDDVDRFFDALLRQGDLARIGEEHGRWFGAPIDLVHPLGRRIADESTVDPFTTWRHAADAVRAARRVEVAAAVTRTETSVTIPGAPAFLEALGYVSDEPWDVVAAVPARPDETRPVDGGRLGLLDFALDARELADLRRPGVTVALEAKDGAVVAVASDDLAFAAWITGDTVTATTDPARTAILADAATAMRTARTRGEQGRAVIAATYGERFRTGR